jgi:GPH family glycoside/pentoside/hexuronide:cation symporter
MMSMFSKVTSAIGGSAVLVGVTRGVEYKEGRPDMVDAPRPQYVRRRRSAPLTFSTKLFQGIGAIPDTVKNWAFNTFTLLFYNQVLGMDAFFVSIALAIAIVFDAITDPLVASISDNSKTRWGRRHPLMLIASLPLGAALFAVYVPPAGLSDQGLFAWLLAFTVLTRGLMTLYFVPWSAIAAELSDDYDERTSVMAFRFAVGWTIGVTLPLFVFTFIMPGTEEYPVGQLNPAGYPTMAFLSGCLMTCGALATTLLTWREIPFLRQHAGEAPAFSVAQTGRELWQALQNRQFALIFLIVLLVSAIGGTTANIGIYMTTFFWGLTTEDLRWLTLSAVGAILAFPFVAVVQSKWDKKHILLSCAVMGLLEGLVLVNLRFLGVLPENGDPMLLVILVGMGVFAVAIAVIQGIIGASIVADLLDEHELRTGYRQEAMFNAALSFSGKAVSGIGTILGGLIITLIGFPTNVEPADVPADAIVRLGVVVGVALPLLYLIPISLISRYRITRAKHAEIKAALEARRLERPLD